MASTFSPVRARAGISLMFFTNGFVVANLLPRYPEVKQAFELSNTEFGVVVAMMALGAIIASWLPAPLIRRFGAGPVAFFGTVALGLAVGTVGFAPHILLVAVAMATAGFADAVTDTAQNVHGLLVEDAYGKSIINSLHALWSLGAFSGGAIGAWAASQRLPLGFHLLATSALAVVLAGVALTLARLPDALARGAAAAAERPESTRLTRGMWLLLLPLGLLTIVGVLPEEAAMNWAALYLVQVVDTPFGVAGLGFVSMIAAQTVGRLLGDPATDRWGAVAVLRGGGVLIALGGVLIVGFPVLPVALTGFALIGFGCATVVPAAYAAAGRLPGLPEGAGVTIASWLLRMGFLATPPLVGFVADQTSLRVGLGILIVSGVAVLALSGRVRPSSPGRS
ncbi:MAG: MFS transporter [Propionibacteriaceae bacterium]|nr:MFS transporter [Propionibacteriaceae bacterium]